jgi:DNA mismatch endonuclease (patch repair protein)
MLVRRAAHSLGFRYRLHDNRLPGLPDLVFPRLKKIIFVHGCFWHRHPGCAMARLPKSNLAFWLPKLNGNRERDQKNSRLLRKEGWRVKVVWECQTKKPERMKGSIERFLNS